MFTLTPSLTFAEDIVTKIEERVAEKVGLDVVKKEVDKESKKPPKDEVSKVTEDTVHSAEKVGKTVNDAEGKVADTALSGAGYLAKEIGEGLKKTGQTIQHTTKKIADQKDPKASEESKEKKESKKSEE
ncbi:MAG: hypothetical protein ACK5LK_01865 [Chthoniobacterales bacterium]